MKPPNDGSNYVLIIGRKVKKRRRTLCLFQIIGQIEKVVSITCNNETVSNRKLLKLLPGEGFVLSGE